MSEPKIARSYDAAKNPDGHALPGVPLRDITVDEFKALPAWLQASIDASPFYSAPKGAPKASAPAPEESASGDG